MVAARALLGWSQHRLAFESGTSAYVVEAYERRGLMPPGYPLTLGRDPLSDIVSRLRAVGVEFTDGDAPGVKLRHRP
jgi:hypothetical protein